MRALNGVAADSLRFVAAGVHKTHVVLWFCIGWLDGGR
jgi:hypothetical protein